MELIVVILVIGAIIIWYYSKSAGRQSTVIPRTEAPGIKLSVTNSYDRGNKEPTDVGELTPSGNNAWILNPKSPLPLTVYNANQELAKKLKELLGTAEYWSQNIPDIALLIAQHNLKFKEVDAFLAEYSAKFNSEVERLIISSPEWHEASEKDQLDLRTEFESMAIESLGVCVGDTDLACLLTGEPANITEDDELVRRFGSDSSLYAFYVTVLGRKSQVFTVKADEYSRKNWEQLTEKGFARRGKDIPIELLLDGLRLKDINELLVGEIEKPIGRKAKAIETALKLPDLVSRLSERISYREMFQVVPPSGIDVEQLSILFAYVS